MDLFFVEHKHTTSHINLISVALQPVDVVESSNKEPI